MRSFVFFLVSLAIVGIGIMKFNEAGWDWSWCRWYLSAVALWLLFMWIYPHKKEFRNDLGKFTACESPFSMEWIGSIIIIGSLLLMIILAIFAGIVWLCYWLITTGSPWLGSHISSLLD